MKLTATALRRLFAGALVLLIAGLLVGGCARESAASVENVDGFWFISYDGPATEGVAFAYITEEDGRLGGGVASAPVGGPLSGVLDGESYALTVEDLVDEETYAVEGRLRDAGARGSWSVRGTDRTGSLSAEPFRPPDEHDGENPFLGTWTDFGDGGETTLAFGEDYRFSGSEGGLDFKGQYAFDEERGILGVYEADEQSVHMELLPYRFEGEDTVVLKDSTYRRQGGTE